MPNKWVNPPPREKATSDVSDQTSTAIGKEISFQTIKEQVNKKPVSTLSQNDRVSEHSWGKNNTKRTK